MKIFKYEVPIKDNFFIDCFTLDLPANSKILTFQAQNNKPFIWVLVDQDNPPVTRYFTINGTGYEIEYPVLDALIYIGTIQMSNGALVWHLFEDVT